MKVPSWKGIGSPRHIAIPEPLANGTPPFASHLSVEQLPPPPEATSNSRHEFYTVVLHPAVAQAFQAGVANDPIEPWEVLPDAVAPEYEWGSNPKHKTYTASDFWSLVERGGPNECWSWKGGFSRATTPVYNVYGRGRTAARHGWGLIHGVLPESQAVRHTCLNGACMNPRHWYLSNDSPPTGCEAVRQFTPFDRERFLGLHRSGSLPMRVLAATFGIPERTAWSLIGLSPNRVAKLAAAAEMDAATAAARADEASRRGFVRDKEQVIEREKQAVEAAEREAQRAVQRAIREAAEKADRERRAIEAAERAVEAEKKRRAAEIVAAKERAAREEVAEKNRKIKEAEEKEFQQLLAFEARHPSLFCSACDRDTRVHSAIASTMTVLPLGHIGFEATMDQSCESCRTHIRKLNYKFTSVLVSAHRKHLVAHNALVEHSVRPIVATRGSTGWRHGIKASCSVTCRLCGFTHAWNVERWKHGL